MAAYHDIALQRMRRQGLAALRFASATDAVSALGAVQAQDYHGAKWGVGQRTESLTSADFDTVFNSGAIVRTHIMRPTWHFVLPEDLRWLLQLTSPRVHQLNGTYYRKLEIDAGVIAQTQGMIVSWLEGGRQLTRPELGKAFVQAGVDVRDLRLGYILMRAELDGLICSGAMKGKQHSYALIEEWVAPAKTLDRDEALAELGRRFFAAHGPAKVRDLAWWSGLTIADGKRAIELIRSELDLLEIDGEPFWFAGALDEVKLDPSTVHLLPNYDELLIAYRDHAANWDPAVPKKLDPWDDRLNVHIIARNGRVVGGWRRIDHGKSLAIGAQLLAPLTESERVSMRQAADELSRFLGIPVSFAE
jgi:hypothetical protein